MRASTRARLARLSAFNTSVQTFPNVLIAGPFGFTFEGCDRAETPEAG